MRHPDLPTEGGCRCGCVRLRITAAPLVTMACHCTGCQRMTSSAYSLNALLPADALEVTVGEPVAGGAKTEGIRHFFCGNCMSWLFTRFDAMPGFVNLRPTMLDDTSWFAPFMETYTSEKLPFAATGAELSFERFPEQARFPEILRAYGRALADG